MIGIDLLGRFLPRPKSTPSINSSRTASTLYNRVFAVTLGAMEEFYFADCSSSDARRGSLLGNILTALPFA